MGNAPSKNEVVEVVDNKTGKVIGKGRLKEYMPDYVTIEQTFDARFVHFKGYEPKKMLVNDEEGN